MEVDVIYGHVKGGWEEEPRLKCVSCYFFFFFVFLFFENASDRSKYQSNV